MPLLTRLLPLALLLLLTRTSLGQPGNPFGPGGPGAGPRLSVELAWRQSTLTPGGVATLGVVMDVTPRWHIQAGQGSGDEKPPYIATTISITAPDGWVARDVRWPEAHVFQIGTGDFAEILAGYEGRVLAAIEVEIPADAKPGEHPIGVEVGYQACDDQVCEMPTSATASTTAMIGAAGAPPAADLAGLFDAVLGGADEPSAFGEDERMKIDLAWYEGTVVAGRASSLGVVFDVAPEWHIQAGAGSGDVGEELIATTIDLELPDGWSAGEVLWPAPHEFVTGVGEFAIPGQGYEGRSIAVVPVTAPADTAPGEYDLSATVGYQACDASVCEAPTTVSGVITATVVESSQSASIAPLSGEMARLFEATLTRTSTGAAAATTDESSGLDVGRLRWWVTLALVFLSMAWMTGRTFKLAGVSIKSILVGVVAVAVSYGAFSFVRAITARHAWVTYTESAFDAAMASGDKTVFIKFTADWCANCQVNEAILMADDTAVEQLSRPDVVAFKVDFTGPNEEGTRRKEALGGGGIPLIAVYGAGEPEPIVFRGNLVSAQPVIDALQGTFVQQTGDGQVFDIFGWQFSVGKDAVLVILGLAFVAGFLMNFTPCVLPVIPIKILSLQAHAKDPKRCFFLGLIFGLGIVALYAALGVVIAGLITGVERLDWGDQFKLWWVNALLGLFVGAMGLGMLGLFAFRLPQFLYMFNPQSDTASGSFFMGVFTAILSTPCTGPLLGATIAWVATQPAGMGFLTLLVMGVGMAFPYVLLTARPAWLEKLPRTGPGSELIKQVMGLLLIAVAVYFVGTAVVGFAV